MEIRGQYWYDLNTGKTIGKYGDKDLGDNGDYCYYGSTGADGKDHRTGVISNSESFHFLTSVCEEYGVKYGTASEAINGGTVEDLSFSQIVSLFCNGDMRTSELEIGLNAKGIEPVTITEQDGMTIVTFKYENKDVTLKCSTEAAKSQIDDIKAEDKSDSISSSVVDGPTGHYNPDATAHKDDWMSCNDYAKYLDHKYWLRNTAPWAIYMMEIINPIFEEYFGKPFYKKDETIKFTKEEIEQIQAHPEIFKVYSVKPSEYDENGLASIEQYTDYPGYDLWFENEVLAGYEVSPEDEYSRELDKFKKGYGTYGHPNCYGTLNGDRVEFTQENVDSILDFISRNNEAPAGADLFGIKVGDDEAAIWEKITLFCKLNGSSDGKSLHIETFYNYVAERSHAYDSYQDCLDYKEVRPRFKEQRDMCLKLTEPDYWGEQQPLNLTHLITAEITKYRQQAENDPECFDKANQIISRIMGQDEFDWSWFDQAEKSGELFKNLQKAYLSGNLSFEEMGYIDASHNYSFGEGFFKVYRYSEFIILPPSSPAELYTEEDIKTGKVDKNAVELVARYNDGTRLYRLKSAEVDYSFINNENLVACGFPNNNLNGNNSVNGTVPLSSAERQKGTPDSTLNVDYDFGENRVNEMESQRANNVAPEYAFYERPIVREITEYFQSLLDSIFQKAYAQTGGSAYKNFTDNPVTDKDSEDYIRGAFYSWSNEDMRQELIDEVEKAIAQALEKYSDVLTSVMYDGRTILFTTIYDTETPDNYLEYNPRNMNAASSHANTYHIVGFANSFNFRDPYNGQLLRDVYQKFEPAIDKARIYTPTPKVYKSNPPENSPIDDQGRDVYKTPWDGVWITGGDDKGSSPSLYIWDEKNQKYLKIATREPGTQVDTPYAFYPREKQEEIINSILAGETKYLPAGEEDCDLCFASTYGYDVENILLSLVYGYNRTDLTNVFEKDGKYYAIDNRIHYVKYEASLEGIAKKLREIEVMSGNTNTTNSTDNAGSNTTNNGSGTNNTIPETSNEQPSNNNPNAGNTGSGNNNVPSGGTSAPGDDYWSTIDKKAAETAKVQGYETGDDGNYYFVDSDNNTYLCLWNPWTNTFDNFLVSGAKDDMEVDLVPNAQESYNAAQNTLESLYAEAQLKAKGYGLIPTKVIGVYEQNGEKYVYDTKKKTFVKEAEAIDNPYSWTKMYIAALELARELGYMPDTKAFGVMVDKDGNKYKYDIDKKCFVECS